MTGQPDDKLDSGLSGAPENVEAFDAPPRSETFVVDIDGFEGPLDLLLALVREHKLDLTKLSILNLAQQYLDFIEQARSLRLEIAADYLVMAAWLAFLKSKLLLPDEEGEDEPTGEELAAQLTHRLRRLDAMRDAAAKLLNRNRLGRDFFARGLPEGIKLVRESKYDANIYDLLKAYSNQRQRAAIDTIRFTARPVVSIQDARERLEKVLGTSLDWAPIGTLILQYTESSELRRTTLASSFSASLEMTREGATELRQESAFTPLFIRKRESSGADR
ncbi:MAG: segregation/condensation protein A [Hyphomicrobiaceae bacterium]|nr:segregation/condensation protein A [Hyphomicrobiaceae bacterium]